MEEKRGLERKASGMDHLFRKFGRKRQLRNRTVKKGAPATVGGFCE